MEIEKTINKYENGLKKEEKENREKTERRLKEERQFYKELEEFIADTAVPTFKKAKTEIHNLGYACECKVFQIYNKEIKPGPIMDRIEMRLSHIKKSKAPLNKDTVFSRLELICSLEKKGIYIRSEGPHPDLHYINGPLPIASISKRNVEEEIEGFIKKVFSISG
jgi:hypothetical protein